jgi:hypothetical protein
LAQQSAHVLLGSNLQSFLRRVWDRLSCSVAHSFCSAFQFARTVISPLILSTCGLVVALDAYNNEWMLRHTERSHFLIKIGFIKNKLNF